MSRLELAQKAGNSIKNFSWHLEVPLPLRRCVFPKKDQATQQWWCCWQTQSTIEHAIGNRRNPFSRRRWWWSGNFIRGKLNIDDGGATAARHLPSDFINWFAWGLVSGHQQRPPALNEAGLKGSRLQSRHLAVVIDSSFDKSRREAKVHRVMHLRHDRRLFEIRNEFWLYYYHRVDVHNPVVI